mmetsp:Transcript_7019/g.14383  ORF Transcript_7019/g.14383 Transcript_7019/m.14383 type:complete len:133 (+) Transcript_7019:205-603(+)
MHYLHSGDASMRVCPAAPRSAIPKKSKAIGNKQRQRMRALKLRKHELGPRRARKAAGLNLAPACCLQKARWSLHSVHSAMHRSGGTAAAAHAAAAPALASDLTATSAAAAAVASSAALAAHGVDRTSSTSSQ